MEGFGIGMAIPGTPAPYRECSGAGRVGPGFWRSEPWRYGDFRSPAL